MKKVLITGIDSFTGNHLVKYLEKFEYSVYGTSLFNSGKKQYICDITKKDDILKVLKEIKPDYLIHLSAISFVAHENMQEFYSVNTIGTINILDTFLELGLNPKKIILASSATVYGNQNKEVLDETLCPKPANHYGASKYAMECLASGYFNKLPIVIVRPFNYTGIGQAKHFLIPKIIKHFKDKKEKIELGNLDIKREFNDISFVCEIYRKILEAKFSSEIINIASQNPISLLEIISKMNKIAGYNIKVEINPLFIRENEIIKLSGSCDKLFNLIGEIKQKNFDETLKEMYND